MRILLPRYMLPVTTWRRAGMSNIRFNWVAILAAIASFIFYARRG
jgi:hypothetical protein